MGDIREVPTVSLEMHIDGNLVRIGSGNDVEFDDSDDTAIVRKAIISNVLGFRLSKVDICDWLKGKCVVITKTWATDNGVSSVSWARWVIGVEKSDYLDEADMYMLMNLKLGGMV